MTSSRLTAQVLTDTPLFFAINSYTEGLRPGGHGIHFENHALPASGGRTACDEIGLPVSATGGVVPCGATALWAARLMKGDSPMDPMLRAQEVRFRYDPETRTTPWTA